MACSGSHREGVLGVTGTHTALSKARERAPSSLARPQAPGEQSPAFSSPYPANNGIKSKLLPRRVTDFKKSNNLGTFQKNENFSHQHFLFEPEFMNFNQINTGMLGINICTVMQNHYCGCNEN